MRAWLAYAAVSLVVLLALAGTAAWLAPEGAARAVWLAAAVAWLLQQASFAALVAVRGQDQLFLLGWAAGIVVRFGVVGVMAFWLARDEFVPRAPALYSLVTFVFVLLLMEPLFLRRGLQTR
ncbi:hypothetical protein BH23GEM10_BH23GEM10_04330 [soil metagenome]